MTFEQLFAQRQVAFLEGEEHLPAGQVTIADARVQIPNRAAIVLLAIATVHADMRLPRIDAGV